MNAIAVSDPQDVATSRRAERDRLILEREKVVTAQMKRWAVSDSIAREIAALEATR